MLKSLLVGVSPTINGGETGEQSGVILRREQVMKVLLDGKAGVIEESGETLGALLVRFLVLIPTFRGPGHHLPIGSLGVVTGKARLGDSTLPGWLEGGIDPLLRQNEEAALPVAPPPQAISSASSTVLKALGSGGATPVVLTPTGNSTPREANETRRDLDKFYASDNDKKDYESSSEEESEENWEEDNDVHDSEETRDDAVDYESSEEDGQGETDGSSAKI